MPTDLLRQGLKLSHLRLIAALADTGGMGAAAARLGTSQPAASRLAAEAERIAGVELYRRSGRGIELTEAGQALAFRSHRILQELGDAGRDLTELRAGLAGRVNLGSVTGPAIEYVLPAVRQLRVGHPGISVRVEVATSDILGPMLLRGEIDFALCRLPEGRDPDLFTERRLAAEPLAFIVRQAHPLLTGRAPELGEMLDHDWVLPVEGAILRTTIERTLRSQGLPMPSRVLSTSSFLFTLAMVRQSNAIAPIARPVAEAFAGSTRQDGTVAILPAPVTIEVEPFALLTRANQMLTPAADVLYREIALRARSA